MLSACTTPAAPRAEPAPSAAPAITPRVRFTPAGEGDVPAIVQAFASAARAEGRTPVVYVGASWCEPCRYFHAAVERGDLEGADLPPLALLELDRDRDGARLDAAGYGSEMIPLFAIPAADGRAGPQRIEGSIHGPGSPAQIVPRLRAILPAP